MKKVKAYSLIELMVVMVIGSITIAIAYQGYLMFYKQFLSFKSVSQKNSEIMLVDALLNTDIKDSKEVLKRGSGIVCTYNNKEVLYNWSELYVTRKQATVVDTFFIKNTNFKVLRDGKDSNENELIDELSFEGEDNMKFYFKKNYGADILVNSEIKNNL